MADCCTKCGDSVRVPAQPSAKERYCPSCLVRLGLLPRAKAGVIVRPDAADFYQKQLDEPIYDTWLIETELRNERTTYARRNYDTRTARSLSALLGECDDAA